MKDKEEDALWLLVERRQDNTLHEFEALSGCEGGLSPKIVASPTPRKAVDGKENNCNSLLTPSATPFTSLLDVEPQKNITAQNGITKVCASELKLIDCQDEPVCGENYSSKQIFSSKGIDSSEESCRPSSSDTQTSITFKPDSPTDTFPSSKPMVRTMTITSARTSTRTASPEGLSCKSTSRSGTPATRPPKPLTVSSMSAPPGRSCSVGKLGHKTIRNPALSRGKQSEMPDSATDAPQNVTTSVVKTPVSTSRCRSGTRNSSGKLRQSSPSSKQSPNGSCHHAIRRAYSEDGENVSPAQVGTKMVERVVNMRRLAPPKQEGESRSRGSAGFGRTLSKNSLDMALRHMDIGGSIPGNLPPLVKSGMAQSRTNIVSESPLVMSGNASSELSSSSIQ